MPASSSSCSVPWTTSAAAAWPNWWATLMWKCQSWCEYGWALHVTSSDRGVDVAVFLDAQVQLEVGPIRRERVENLLEVFGKRHDCGLERTWPTRSPIDLEGLLALLERLDGAEEVAVVRSALEAGVPRERVLDELEREVTRRLARLEER